MLASPDPGERQVRTRERQVRTVRTEPGPEPWWQKRVCWCAAENSNPSLPWGTGQAPPLWPDTAHHSLLLKGDTLEAGFP